MTAVEKLIEVNRLHAFTNTNVQAWRALRFMITDFKVTAPVLAEMTGEKIDSKIPAIDLVDEFILCLLNDMRKDSSLKSRYGNALREMTIVYQNYINSGHVTTKRNKELVSVGVIEAIKTGEKTKVIAEHRTPVKVLRDKMLEECFTLEEVRNFMLNNVEIVYVTDVEDKLIPPEFKSAVPVNGDRYEIAGISVHDVPIYFRESMLK